MGYMALEKLLDKSHSEKNNESVYKLVILASKRALEIAEGKPKMVSAPLEMKPSTVALQEIAEGKLYWKKIKVAE
jgi:DNA-directed RNA polymerase omega subunit